MSVSISAVPVLLIASLISSSLAAIERKNTFDQMTEKIKNQSRLNNGTVKKEIINEICKEYDTVFVDKDVLLKTLNEYGFDEIDDSGDKITCKTDGFNVHFYKVANWGEEKPEPYKMLIEAVCDETRIDELIGDISEQYTSNTQEESYKKIKERLEKHKLKISEEEVLDDNSIVLTINVD